MSPERAEAERAAMQRAVSQDAGTLRKIAITRARLQRADLRERPIACAVSATDVTFSRDDRATYTITYACGVEPWRPGRGPAAATPTVPLDMLKEHGTWLINAML